MHSYIQHSLPPSFAGLYPYIHEIRPGMTTRQANDFVVPRYNSGQAARLPLFHFPKLWNESNLDMALLSEGQVKSLLRNHYLSQYSEHVQCANARCNDCMK